MSYIKKESVIDSPKASLCPDVWEQVMDVSGSRMVWALTTEARLKLEKVATHLMNWMKISGYEVHIVGSITSNQYSATSDIDVHFCKLNENDELVPVSDETAQAYTKMLRTELKENFKDMYLADSYIGQHPIEVYFQGNIYQDYMSVGCYDLFRQRWLVGPELKDPKFNPLSEYYRDIIACAEHTLASIRQQLLKTYEAAMVYMKTKDADQATRLAKVLQDDVLLYKAITQRRKACSTPISIQDALKKRESRSWKISDATFKLIDKFGYMPIFKSFERLAEVMSSSTDIADEVATAVVQQIKKFIGDEKRIQEKEALHESKNIARAQQLKQVFESWNPDFDDKPQNEFGENWEKLDGSHWIVQKLKKMAADCQINPDKDEPKEDRIYVWNVHKVEGDGPYIVNFGGGANGGGEDDKWLSYLSIVKKMAKKIFDEFGSVWLLDFDNDCCDDVWTLRLCFREKKEEDEEVNVPAEPALPMLPDFEAELDEVELDEGAADEAKSLAFAALLVIPGLCSAEQIQKGMKEKNPVQAVQAIRDKASPNKTFSGYSYSHAVNIIALTLMWEAENQGKKGIDMVASVLLNRCKGDVSKLPLACLKSAYSSKAGRYIWQFSCWDETSVHGIKRSTQTPQNYRIFLPRQVRNGKKASIKMWNYCNEVAVKLCNGEFKPITTATEYFNYKKVSPKWKNKLKDTIKVGDHLFGRLGKYHAPYV